MTTSELKSYIDRILGNNIRLLLPSYWWKKAFGAVVDNMVNSNEVKTINGESVIGEGDLRVGVKSVESVEELNALDAEVGDIASVGVDSEQAIKVSDCLLPPFTPGVVDDWDKLSVVTRIEEKTASLIDTVLYLRKSKESLEKGTIIVGCVEGKPLYIKAENGHDFVTTLQEINDILSHGDYRIAYCLETSQIDSSFNFYRSTTKSDAYIKSDSWEKLAKEHIVASESELNSLDVPMGTIAKVAETEGNAIFLSDCYQFSEDDFVDGIELKDGAHEKCTTIIGLQMSVPTVNLRGTYIDFIESESASFLCVFVVHNMDNDTYEIRWEHGTLPSNVTKSGTLWKPQSQINQSELDKVNKVLSEGNFKFHSRSAWYDGTTVGAYDIIDNFLKSVISHTYSVNAYIKGETWTRLLKEGDATGGGSITVDSELSETSENPVQNKVVTEALGTLEEGYALNAQQIGILGTTKADTTYVDEQIANISSGEGLEYRKLYAKGDILGIVTGELTSEQKAYNIETINLYRQNKAIIGYEQVIGNISRIAICKGTDSNGESVNFYFNHVINASTLISVTISADGNGTYQSENGLLIDSVVLDSSTNAVQNKAIKAYVDTAISNAITNTLNTSV